MELLDGMWRELQNTDPPASCTAQPLTLHASGCALHPHGWAPGSVGAMHSHDVVDWVW